MRLSAPMAICCVFLLAAAEAPTTQPILDGVWVATSARFDGQEAPDDVLRDLSIVIRNERMSPLRQPNDVAKVVVDRTKSPMWFDTIDAQGQVNKGIFELSGDSLRLCSAWPGEDRPAKFESAQGSRVFLVSFSKSKESTTRPSGDAR